MPTPRALFLEAIKTVEPDAKRALRIADFLAAEFRRHPQLEATFILSTQGEVTLLRAGFLEAISTDRIEVSVHSPKRGLQIKARVIPRFTDEQIRSMRRQGFIADDDLNAAVQERLRALGLSPDS